MAASGTERGQPIPLPVVVANLAAVVADYKQSAPVAFAAFEPQVTVRSEDEFAEVRLHGEDWR